MPHQRKGKGHELELLIEKIERAIASTPMEIKLNDMVRDKYGDIREVDISIRGKLGTVDVFIIIECRNRKSVQDKRWVEEIASKRDSLQANKAILVSGSGFYKSAYTMAADKGIVLRTVKQITYDDIKDWLQFSSIRINMYEWQHNGYEVAFTTKVEMKPSFVEFIVKQFGDAAQNPAKPILTTQDGKSVSTELLWDNALDNDKQIVRRWKSIIDKKNKPLKIKHRVPINFDLFFNEFPDVLISQITFLITASKNVKHVDVGAISRYSEPQDNIAQLANFSTDLNGVQLNTDFIRHEDGKTTILIRTDKPLKGRLDIRVETTNDEGKRNTVEFSADNSK